ncbi:acetylornithine transaminase [Tessaracoccus rhinocerotis]|uniref:Acetylornithine aminotransferase n=1 Tax=Tessaracoccus rhinocerotis TaxID=1689449 RepID=A0A553K306_9ACTN|nr:acetylornithine transaminase [Tessaracoccus rhinocerotis]TRY19065.1 acetylornithine transaminase [Tessaracoccus rhinocerotis]
MTNQDLLGRYEAVMMNAFGTPKRAFVSGDGVHLTDADGKSYVDLLAGIAVNALGHNHPRVVEAITSQLHTLGHVSNFFATEGQVRLAERLAAAASDRGDARVFFANSGAEANEAAFKLTRLTGRTRIVAMEGSFHGRTIGSLAITHTAKYREPFEPLPGDVEFVPFGDVAALEAAVDHRTAAVVLEPIQGEAGVVPAPEGYLAEARRITSEHGALLWIDEVQTGIGRAGELLLHRAAGVTADVVTLAKGLANGFPIGACIAVGPAGSLLTPGLHGSTFGGNPVAAAAANAVLDELEGGVLDNAREVGQWFADAVEGLHEPLVSHVRGRGLLLGIVLNEPIAAAVVDLALEAGWVANAPRPDVIRVAPPLVITADELAGFVHALPELLARAHG